MRRALVLALVLSTGCAGPVEIGSSHGITVPTGNFSEALYWASVEASGSRLCNTEAAARYGADFNHRFGQRIRKLMRAHEARFGKDPGFIVTTSCRTTLHPVDYSDAAHQAAHKRAMDDFDRWLTRVERGEILH